MLKVAQSMHIMRDWYTALFIHQLLSHRRISGVWKSRGRLADPGLRGKWPL